MRECWRGFNIDLMFMFESVLAPVDYEVRIARPPLEFFILVQGVGHAL